MGRTLTLGITALLLTACGNTTPPAATVTVTPSTTTPSMNDWRTESADESANLSQALRAVGDAITNRDLPAMRIGCTQLRSSVDALERDLPSPNPKVDTALHGALDDYRSVSQLCMTIRPGSTEEVTAMSDLIDSGTKHMKTAINLMG